MRHTIRQKSIALSNVFLVALLLLAILFSTWLAFFARPEGGVSVSPTGGIQDAQTEPKAQPKDSPVASAAKGTADASTPSGPADTAGTKPPAVDTEAPSPPADSSVSGILTGMPKLIIPVAGVKREQLTDTFNAARSENRVHNAIDIMAGHGTPVLAADNGVIKRLFHSERGGNTLYQISRDGRLVYYYAHLDSYAGGLSEGKEVKQGDTIGYVGDTGNAGAGNYHLHFSIWKITDPKRFWEGENINPYPLLR
jgi:murein DD-endopeptidase MepM/ murein hydrolase activator NlpD